MRSQHRLEADPGAVHGASAKTLTRDVKVRSCKICIMYLHKRKTPMKFFNLYVHGDNRLDSRRSNRLLACYSKIVHAHGLAESGLSHQAGIN
jgi:hypothetical protein